MEILELPPDPALEIVGGGGSSGLALVAWAEELGFDDTSGRIVQLLTYEVSVST